MAARTTPRPTTTPRHDHPLQHALRLLSRKWTMHVLIQLHGSVPSLRFSALQRAIGVVTQKELTKHLRNLEQVGLISRTVHAGVPPKVEYALTAMGRSLVEPLQGLTQWAQAHARELSLQKR